MTYGRDDRDLPSRSQHDDRQRLTGRWVQDDETGYLRRRFEDDDQNEAYPGSRGNQDYEDRRNWGNAGGYYGEPNRRPDRGGGHAFDFARRDSGRSDLDGRDDNRSDGGQGRFRDQGYHTRAGYDGRAETFNGARRGEWPQANTWTDRYDDKPSDRGRGAMRAGSFRGKGPKGYVRSDERIKEDVSDRLSDDDTLDASNITVEVSGGEVTLSGYVDSRQAKHTAEECAEQCAGVTHVQNNLRVGTGASADRDSTSSGRDLLHDRAKATDV